MPRHSTVVYGAILANLGIAISKYIAGFITGSPAMLAEAYHSTADTGNELLLLLGLRRSTRTPDALHPFGHGKAVYFYSLLVAVFIFGFGGALAAYEGISRIRRPEPPGNPFWNYLVLGIAAVFEFNSWRIARRELREKAAEGATLWETIRDSKDPATFTVFLEDSAALIGIAFAFLGVLLAHLDVQELEASIDRPEEKIRSQDPTIERIFLEADSLRPGRRPAQAA